MKFLDGVQEIWKADLLELYLLHIQNQLKRIAVDLGRALLQE
jgi:hypothetical protein